MIILLSLRSVTVPAVLLLLAAALPVGGDAGSVVQGAAPGAVPVASFSWASFTQRVSVTESGRQMIYGAYSPTSKPVGASDNGRYVLFQRTFGNRVMIRDRWTGTTRSFPGDATTEPVLSGNGRYVVFEKGFEPTLLYRRDLWSGSTALVSAGLNGRPAGVASASASVSADGRYVAFASAARNLVKRPTNLYGDVFVRDMRRHRTMLVSVTNTGRTANGASGGLGTRISGNGNRVFFFSEATNLTAKRRPGLVLHNMITGRNRWLLPTSAVGIGWSRLTVGVSADGRNIAYIDRRPCSAGHCLGVYVRNLATGATHLVSIDNNGSAFLEFWCSDSPSLSADGNIVAFGACPEGRPFQVYVRDLRAHRTRLISVSLSGRRANGESMGYSVSADGRIVGFYSDATNLVRHDTNRYSDAFVRRW